MLLGAIFFWTPGLAAERTDAFSGNAIRAAVDSGNVLLPSVAGGSTLGMEMRPREIPGRSVDRSANDDLDALPGLHIPPVGTTQQQSVGSVRVAPHVEFRPIPAQAIANALGCAGAGIRYPAIDSRRQRTSCPNVTRNRPHLAYVA